ncbi:MAG: SAM-dependent methyltransferase [Fibrobacteres bacterium]|nr:SAM-dependent methyltransferase [Fibrobacterota bacterium]
MAVTDNDKVFAGSIPGIYETILVPLIFQPYAADIAARLALLKPGRVLEIAAGTGAVTRAMASALPASTAIVATDLSQGMLDEAARLGTSRPVEWRQADAMRLPFEDASFDAVVCQFGAMFFPDKAKAYSEARRVLRPGGVFLFNVWDGLEENGIADAAQTAMSIFFPDDPPSFLLRTPYGYHDRKAIERDLAAGGFTGPARIDAVATRSKAESARGPAIGFCQGTPMRGEIEKRAPDRLGEATDAVEEAIASRFGRGAVDVGIQALIVSVTR